MFSYNISVDLISVRIVQKEVGGRNFSLGRGVERRGGGSKFFFRWGVERRGGGRNFFRHRVEKRWGSNFIISYRRKR